MPERSPRAKRPCTPQADASVHRVPFRLIPRPLVLRTSNMVCSLRNMPVALYGEAVLPVGTAFVDGRTYTHPLVHESPYAQSRDLERAFEHD